MGHEVLPLLWRGQIPGKTRALIIGMNYEATNLELEGCINDGQEFYDMIKNKYNYNDIQFITDGSRQVNKNNFLEFFEWLLKDVQPKDRLVFYFSGHGKLVDNDNAIICSNGEVLLDNEIWTYLISRIPQGTRLNIFIDCCNSGTMGDLKFNYQYINSKTSLSILNEKDVQGNILCFSACYDEQLAADNYRKARLIQNDQGKFILQTDLPRGVFTYFLIKVLQENSFDIIWQDLLEKTQIEIYNMGYRQSPQFSSSSPIFISKKFKL